MYHNNVRKLPLCTARFDPNNLSSFALSLIVIQLCNDFDYSLVYLYMQAFIHLSTVRKDCNINSFVIVIFTTAGFAQTMSSFLFTWRTSHSFVLFSIAASIKEHVRTYIVAKPITIFNHGCTPSKVTFLPCAFIARFPRR